MWPRLAETVAESKIRAAHPEFPDCSVFLVLFSDRVPWVSMMDGAELRELHYHGVVETRGFRWQSSHAS
jgi:hypothetical protein